MIIRKYKPKDTKEIETLVYETIHIVNAKDYTKDQLDAWAPKEGLDFEKRLKDLLCYVAFQDNVIIGFISLRKDGLIDHLFVHKDFQRKQVASNLLAKVEKEAKELNIIELFTESSITAKDFFLSKDFSIEKEYQKHLRDEYFKNYLMKKDLI